MAPDLDMTGRKVIVRTSDAGVHFGTLASRTGGEAVLTDSRRLWYWRTADKGISLSDVAVGGIDPKGSKICATLPQHLLIGVIEVIPATSAAAASIETADVYRA
jgi:hypothetical protein